MKYLLRSLPAFALIAILYFIGPAPAAVELNGKISPLKGNPQSIEKMISEREKSIKNIKPDNEARIVWADSTKREKTPYCLVYLHGFSASQEEGNPVHRDFAKRYGMNLYLSRLSQHGLKEKEPMLHLTPENLLESAKEAVAIGEKLGEKVILMSTSTGGTLSLYIASANHEIGGLILYSPNIDLYDGSATLLNKHWGLQIARLVMNGNYMKSYSTSPSAYWTKGYRLEALIALRSLLDATMNEEVFNKVTQPVFLGYYYKNEEEQDHVVSVPAMLEMYEELGTPDSLKEKVAFAQVGDHCMANRFQSKDVKSVEAETYKFAEEVLKLKPVSSH